MNMLHGIYINSHTIQTLGISHEDNLVMQWNQLGKESETFLTFSVGLVEQLNGLYNSLWLELWYTSTKARLYNFAKRMLNRNFHLKNKKLQTLWTHQKKKNISRRPRRQRNHHHHRNTLHSRKPCGKPIIRRIGDEVKVEPSNKDVFTYVYQKGKRKHPKGQVLTISRKSAEETEKKCGIKTEIFMAMEGETWQLSIWINSYTPKPSGLGSCGNSTVPDQWH